MLLFANGKRNTCVYFSIRIYLSIYTHLYLFVNFTSYEPFVHFYFIWIYLLICLLLSFFSFRFEKVHTDSKRVWKYYRYSVVTEYLTKIPTPLNILIRPFICLRNLCREGRKSSLNHKSLKNYLYTCCKKTRPCKYKYLIKQSLSI